MKYLSLLSIPLALLLLLTSCRSYRAENTLTPPTPV